MKRKLLITVLILLLITGCKTTKNDDEKAILDLPVKDIPNSVLMSESPITPLNIDDYLFRDDCVYLDLRSPEQYYQEGAIAGFYNLPFYGYIADVRYSHKSLYQMVKKEVNGELILLGSTGSFEKNYEEADEIINYLIPKDKNILIISTAGVESSYFMSLLLQLGYDGSKLYNVGSFTNAMIDAPAYRLYEDAKYLIPTFELTDTSIEFKWDNLTLIDKQ